MESGVYTQLKTMVNSFTLPGAVFSVEKNTDGSCGDVRFFAINEAFKRGYYDMFIAANDCNNKTITYDEIHTLIEGQPYTTNLPKEPNFEEICFRAAWKGEHIHTYVDTRKLYGYWTEDILLPVECSHPDNISYCLFLYTLNKDLDAGKYAAVSPDVSSFVLKTCLELRDETEFYSSMNKVTNDLREYTDSFAACILTIDKEQKSREIISESMREKMDNTIKELFSSTPFKMFLTWEAALSETNIIIVKDEHDMAVLEKKAPDWVKHMRENDVHTLALVPFIHQGEIIGYLYLTDFNSDNVVKIKEAIELVSFFLTAEIANHIFMEKLEYLSNVDILTGVLNRNCMNINVDELSLKLKLNPQPFSVAFCDLNGLKNINDEQGHGSGDKLLKEAAILLKEVFVGDQIYRAGGDEFTIISLHSTQEEFEAKINLLREKACNPDWLYFAIGTYYDAKGGSLRKAMHYADERMYKDKKEFYDKFPDRKR
ncbi:diguanylate cyclase (GGDEF) domain-containing protein [Pseudobutyrivibrio sp. AR14]|uniref:sensor domain-containing diguanylate cyclase n=1 Tax=Pseudobutyrivibrio sp. AR14 TaxID=1520804 RepID=UPI00088C15B7|nr:GGDEF domain-containing protein [Pseudobutyrivibrio sp. AR14]SCX85056.1 diguanylate cyclase (GGDEF) domain-containing protein [Pseudobutyrivibrio sp. AR14]